MAINHENGDRSGRALCDELLRTFRLAAPNVVRGTGANSCSFSSEGRAKFAYAYHVKSDSHLNVFFRSGSVDTSAVPGVAITPRAATGNAWAKRFPAMLRLENTEQVPAVSQFLVGFPLSLTLPSASGDENSTSYERALRSVASSLTSLQRDILEALAAAGESGLSARQLATLLSRKDPVEINGAFGRVGHSVFDRLGAHPDGLAEGEFQWWHILATALESPAGFRWVLRPQVINALLKLQLVEAAQTLPDELPDVGQTVSEGAYRQIRVNAFERNPVARRRCLQVHGHNCSACGLDFGAFYGSAADGYIHVHHLTPLSDIGVEHEVDPIKDLRPVCPNCHAVIHLRIPPYSVEEVRKMVRGKGPVG